MNSQRKTRRQKERRAPSVDVSAPAGPNNQAKAAVEIMEKARALREQAEHGDLGLIAYLLDMVVIEARDTARAVRAREAKD